MSRLFYHVMQDNAGNLLFDVSGTMRLAGTGTVATIYGDEALTVVLPNPMTNHPSFGSFKCFLGAGDYDFHMAKSGYTFETLTGVQGHGTMAQQNANAVLITGGAVGGLSALGSTGAADLSSLLVQTTSRLSGPTGIGAAPLPGQYTLVVAAGKTLWQAAAEVGVRIDPVGYAFRVEGTMGLNGGSAAIVNTTSRAALKQAIRPLTGAVQVVRQLQARAWEWAESARHLEQDQPGTQTGFVVEEVAQVKPEWTPVTSAGEQGLRMHGLDAYVVATLQEVLVRLDAIEARLA